MEAKTVASTLVQMSELMTPNDANFLGKVFGGAILSLLDHCAYVTASRFAGRICVTASFDRVDFHSPIDVGELVHMEGRVEFAGRTSVQTRIEVYAENISIGTMRHTNSCVVTMVAIDENGTPTPVPKLVAETRDEKLRVLEGRARRTRSKEEAHGTREQLEKLSDEEIERLIEAG
ncbi:MAG: acyl-CoA thioesterase [Fimbriimonadales bacterium]